MNTNHTKAKGPANPKFYSNTTSYVQQYDVKMSKPKKYGWPRNRVTYVCAAKLSIILSNNPLTINNPK